MKYKHFLFPIAGIIMIAAIIVSCAKQEPTELNSSSPEISQSTADIQIENKIKAFKGKLEYLRENPSFKSSETMTVDSAVWYLKAALNYTYARAGIEFANIVNDSAKIIIPTAGNELYVDALPDVYQEFIDSLSVKYHAIQSLNKNLIVVNLIADEPTENGTEVTLYSATGKGIPVTYGYGLFDTTDYWYWGYGLGKCDIYQGQYDEEDATTQLQYKINHPIASNPPGTYFIPDTTNTGWIYPWYNNGAYEDPNSPNGVYRLFYDDATYPPNEEPCIPPDDMNYYLYEGVKYIMEYNKPAGKYLTLGEVFYTSLQDGLEVRVHIVRFTYGNRYISEDPPEDL